MATDGRLHAVTGYVPPPDRDNQPGWCVRWAVVLAGKDGYEDSRRPAVCMLAPLRRRWFHLRALPQRPRRLATISPPTGSWSCTNFDRAVL